ncbi:MAG: YheC/YheD family protein [Chloroflexota bacterium]
MSDLLIGVLVYPIMRRKKWFGEQHSFLISMNQAALSQGARLALFEPINIDWRNRRIHGYGIVGRRVIRESFRFPDVIYDRFFPRFYRRRPSYTATVRRLQRSGIPFINAYLGGKLRVYEELSEEPELRVYLPETKPLSSPLAAGTMLERYGRVFLKPVNGTQGAGVIRVDKVGDNYSYVGRIDFKRIGPKVVSKHGLYELIARVIAGRPYLVQQPISLKTSNRSVMDIRVVVQKAGGPAWHVTGMAWRVGAPNAVTSNLHTGGHAEPVEEPLRSEVAAAALKIAAAIDKRLGPFGELGLDFGVDTDDRIWFIEANGRLGRAIFHQLRDRDGAHLAHIRPIQYARWISEHEPVMRAHTGRRPAGYRA